MKSSYCFCLDGLTIQAKKNFETLIVSLGFFCFLDGPFMYVHCTKLERNMIDDIVNATVALYDLAH